MRYEKMECDGKGERIVTCVRKERKSKIIGNNKKNKTERKEGKLTDPKSEGNWKNRKKEKSLKTKEISRKDRMEGKYQENAGSKKENMAKKKKKLFFVI
jgi:hypothetical protein